MKKLVLALLFTLPCYVLLAQNVKVIPASTNPSAKKEATIEYNPGSTSVKHDAASSSSHKKVKCVPGCNNRKHCITKTESSQNPPHSDEKAIETSKK